jgi:hypothetical protein
MFLFVMSIALCTPAWAAHSGDVAMFIKIEGMQDMLSSLMQGVASGMGEDFDASQVPTDAQIPNELSVSGAITIQGDNLRISLNDPTSEAMGAVASVAMELILNSADKYLYLYYPDTLNGSRVSLATLDAGGLAGSGGLIGNRNYDEVLKQNKDRVKTYGSKVVFGFECTGYSVTLDGPQGMKIDADMWVANELEFPIAVRARMSGMNLTWELHNLSRVPDQAASYFKPPRDAKLTEISGDQLLSTAMQPVR